MAPIRRYLRITKGTILEVRIYLDVPSDASWLLSKQGAVLGSVLAAVRPHVLPKLREEKQHQQHGTKKKKLGGVKDVVNTDEFEVMIFFTEVSSRHAVLTKKKGFKQEDGRRKGTPPGGKMKEWLGGKSSRENPIRVEEDEDEDVALGEIPEALNVAGSKDEGEEGLFVSSGDEDETGVSAPRAKKRRRPDEGPGDAQENEDDDDDDDDRKKLAMQTSYNGFSIWGRILCLVVKRKGARRATTAGRDAPGGAGNSSQMMEQWVSTQAGQDAGLDEEGDDEG